MKNAIIAQSGGPTTVINNSIRGAIDVLNSSKKINKIFGAKMGILGVLNEELLDISSQDLRQIVLLEKTPSAGLIGSCRYKIKSKEDLERVIEVFQKHDIGYFLYCGGGDSMDTANKISILAKGNGLEIKCIGIPKTIDNDVGGKLQEEGTFSICDHDPGYGSVARNTAINVLEANQENMASYTSDPVLIIGVMGRKIGFIPASARLADRKREMPLLVILPEAFIKNDGTENLDYVTSKINEILKEQKRCIVIIGEGVNLGMFGERKDSFGHSQFSSSKDTVEQILTNYLNGIDRNDGKTRLVVKGSARSEKPGTRQRREIAYASGIDLEEAYMVGKFAADTALAGESGYMATIIRIPGKDYKVKFEKVLLDVVANSDREFPKEWITDNRVDITDEYINWALPLIGEELPLFSKFEPIFSEKKCKPFVPFSYRV